MFKNLAIIFSLSLILFGCQKAIDPVVNISARVGDKVQSERQKQIDKTNAIVKCQELCQIQLSSDGQDFDQGPCLSNQIAPDWVCDVAHEPRQPLDDQPENQCSGFRQGQAHHFVEVDGNCNMIKVF